MSNSYPGGILTAGADTGFSVSFDGTGDYLSTPSTTALQLTAATAFTIEAWVYPTSLPNTDHGIIGKRTGGTGEWQFFIKNDKTLHVYSTGGDYTSGTTIGSLNQWIHCAVTWDLTTLRFFINGVLCSTTHTSIALGTPASSDVTIGASYAANELWYGYLSNVRVVKGTALYTATFTPPTQLFTVPGTSLLACQSPTLIDKSNNNFTITVNGDAKVSNFTPFTGYKGFNPALGSAASGIWSIEEATNYQSNREWPIYDPYYKFNTLLLRGNGSNTATNSTFTDGSSNNFTITRNGNTTQGSFSPFNPKGYSLYIPGSDTSYVQTPTGTTTALLGGALTSLGSLSFTIEFFINTPGNTFIVGDSNPGNDNTNMILSISSAGLLEFGGTFGGYTTRTSTAAAPLNTWCHVAWVVSGGYVYFYVNGVPAGSATVGNTSSQVGQLIWGGYNNSFASRFYISNFRITKSAIYNGPFQVPTSKLTALTNTSLLAFQENNLFKDNSDNNYALTRNGVPVTVPYSPFVPTVTTPTTYSNWFDGTGDYLTAPNAAWMNLGTSDFTIECWTQFNTVGSTQMFVSNNYNAGNGAGGWAFLYRQDNTTLLFTCNSNVAYGKTFAPVIDRMYHVAVCRSGTDLRLFVDGTQIGTTSTSSDNITGASSTLFVGSNETNALPINGLISNLRIVKGTALYTTNFTPPSGPLTAVPNTQFLSCQSSSFVDNSVNAANLTTFGNVQPVTSPVPFAPKVDQTSINASYLPTLDGGSAYFDGTGDRLTFTDSSNALDLGGRAASIEAWVYPIATSGIQHIIFKSGSGTDWNTTNGVHYAIAFDTGNKFYFVYNVSGTATFINGATTRAPNQWYHVVVATDASNNIALFVNGVRDGTATNAISKPTTRTTVNIGTNNSGTEALTGYICGQRFITGSGAYDPTKTAIALPLTAPTAISGTELLLNYTNAGIFDQSGTENFEAISNDPPKISTLQSKWGGSSIAFNSANTGSSIPYLLANRHTNHHAFYGGDFTVEAWVYILANNDLSSDIPILNYGNGGANGPLGTATAWAFIVQNNGAGLKFYRNTDASTEVSVSWTGTVPYNQWAHVAVSRVGTALRAFVNGFQIGSTSTSSTSYAPISGTNRLFVGAQSGGGGNSQYYKFPGYMQDVRITKGIARYTTNFTPPTSGMQNQ